MRRSSVLLAVLCLLASPRARGFEEVSSADRNLAAIIAQLETGDWNARIHAVHELDYMRSEGLPGLDLATQDGDWQVRMTAVHAIGSRGAEGAPILKKLLKNEPCPVVRLITLHNLGSSGPEGEEVKAMNWISGASQQEVNGCRDQAGPGLAPWARPKVPAGRAKPPADAAAPPRGEGGNSPRVREFPPGPQRSVERGFVADDVAPRGPSRRPEDLPDPATFRRHAELDALLENSTATIPRRGVVAFLSARSTAAPESLPWSAEPIAREHPVSAPGLIMPDAGGKAPHDPLPGLLRALKQGDVRMRYAVALALSRIDTPEAREAFRRHIGKEARRAIDRRAGSR